MIENETIFTFPIARWMRGYRKDVGVLRTIVSEGGSHEGGLTVEQTDTLGIDDETEYQAEDHNSIDTATAYEEPSEDEFTINDVELEGEAMDSDCYTDNEEKDLEERFDFNFSDSDCEESETLEKELSGWAIKGCLPRDQLSSLLKILKRHNNTDLPSDARTLLKTPRDIAVSSNGGGDYVYIGIAANLNRICALHPEAFQNQDKIVLQCNCDGLPPFKSSSLHIWPILCKFGTHVFAVSIWSGEKDPTDQPAFFADFLEELQRLLADGVWILGKHYEFDYECFICDSPARSFCKGIKHHSGYSSCERCCVMGVRLDFRMCLLDLNSEKRTDEKFSRMEYVGSGDVQDQHQMRPTSLCDYDIKCVSKFVLDSMHLVYQGVTKRVLEWLTSSAGPRNLRLSTKEKEEISRRLKNYNGKLPREYARQPRSLLYLARWKATEFREFLLVTGMIVLKDVVCVEVYEWFINLVVAIRILNDEDLIHNEKLVDYAEGLLRFFVSRSGILLGETFIVYNVHCLIHLADDVRQYKKPLSAIDAFPFENHLQVIKKMVRNATSPCKQIIKRLQEFESASVERNIRVHETSMTVGGRDSWFMMTDGQISRVVAIDGQSITVVAIPPPSTT